MKKIKIFDVIIIALALLCGIGLIFSSSFSDNADKGICVIKVNGQEIRKIDLSMVSDDEVIKIDNEYGENHILITKDGVSVTYSDCVQKVEIQDKPIYKPGQSLVCLPHRLVIEIVGDGDNPDAVTY